MRAIFALIFSLSLGTLEVHSRAVSQRDVTPAPHTPPTVQQLSDELTAVLLRVQGRIRARKLVKVLNIIAEHADEILQNADITVSEQDIRDLISGISSDYQPLLDTANGTKGLNLALELLKDLTVKLNTDQDNIYVTVAAVRWTAQEIARIITGIERFFINFYDELRARRQDSGWKFDFENGLSHTWDHGSGSSTTVGAKPGFLNGGLSGQLYGNHEFDLGSGTANIGATVGYDNLGWNGGLKGSYSNNGWDINGNLNFDHNGKPSGGFDVLKSWNNGKTQFGGGLNFDSQGNTNAGLKLIHKFKRSEDVE